MPSIRECFAQVRNQIPQEVRLIVVSKTQPVDAIGELYHCGQRAFGENRVQELLEKQAQLPADIEWHMIGHLQSNKVRYIVPFVKMIHSVDSESLLISIEKEATKANRVIDCLLQVHIAEEETKFGFSHDELLALIKSPLLPSLKNSRICGLMGMATYTDNTEQIRREFRQLKTRLTELSTGIFSGTPWFRELSTGMSGDFAIAIEEGSTMVRIGSSIFGARH